MDSPNNPNHSYNSTVYKYQVRAQQQPSLFEREQELIARLYALEREKAELSKQLVADKGVASSRLEISRNPIGHWGF